MCGPSRAPAPPSRAPWGITPPGTYCGVGSLGSSIDRGQLTEAPLTEASASAHSPDSAVALCTYGHRRHAGECKQRAAGKKGSKAGYIHVQ